MSNCNCEGKTINLSLGCCQPVLAPIENYYTKYQIDKMLSGGTSGCCITPEEVDEKIESAKTEIESEIPSLSGYATERWVEDQHYISGVDLSDYALKSEIPTSNSGLTNDAQYITSGDTVFNNYMLKNQIWCGSEAEWSEISGSTDLDKIYFIY